MAFEKACKPFKGLGLEVMSPVARAINFFYFLWAIGVFQIKVLWMKAKKFCRNIFLYNHINTTEKEIIIPKILPTWSELKAMIFKLPWCSCSQKGQCMQDNWVHELVVSDRGIDNKQKSYGCRQKSTPKGDVRAISCGDRRGDILNRRSQLTVQ